MRSRKVSSQSSTKKSMKKEDLNGLSRIKPVKAYKCETKMIQQSQEEQTVKEEIYHQIKQVLLSEHLSNEELQFQIQHQTLNIIHKIIINLTHSLTGKFQQIILELTEERQIFEKKNEGINLRLAEYIDQNQFLKATIDKLEESKRQQQISINISHQEIERSQDQITFQLLEKKRFQVLNQNLKKEIYQLKDNIKEDQGLLEQMEKKMLTISQQKQSLSISSLHLSKKVKQKQQTIQSNLQEIRHLQDKNKILQQRIQQKQYLLSTMATAQFKSHLINEEEEAEIQYYRNKQRNILLSRSNSNNKMQEPQEMQEMDEKDLQFFHLKDLENGYKLQRSREFNFSVESLQSRESKGSKFFKLKSILQHSKSINDMNFDHLQDHEQGNNLISNCNLKVLATNEQKIKIVETVFSDKKYEKEDKLKSYRRDKNILTSKKYQSTDQLSSKQEIQYKSQENLINSHSFQQQQQSYDNLFELSNCQIFLEQSSHSKDDVVVKLRQEIGCLHTQLINLNNEFIQSKDSWTEMEGQYEIKLDELESKLIYYKESLQKITQNYVLEKTTADGYLQSMTHMQTQYALMTNNYQDQLKNRYNILIQTKMQEFQAHFHLIKFKFDKILSQSEKQFGEQSVIYLPYKIPHNNKIDNTFSTIQLQSKEIKRCNSSGINQQTAKCYQADFGEVKNNVYSNSTDNLLKLKEIQLVQEYEINQYSEENKSLKQNLSKRFIIIREVSEKCSFHQEKSLLIDSELYKINLFQSKNQKSLKLVRFLNQIQHLPGNKQIEQLNLTLQHTKNCKQKLRLIPSTIKLEVNLQKKSSRLIIINKNIHLVIELKKQIKCIDCSLQYPDEKQNKFKFENCISYSLFPKQKRVIQIQTNFDQNNIKQEKSQTLSLSPKIYELKHLQQIKNTTIHQKKYCLKVVQIGSIIIYPEQNYIKNPNSLQNSTINSVVLPIEIDSKISINQLKIIEPVERKDENSEEKSESFEFEKEIAIIENSLDGVSKIEQQLIQDSISDHILVESKYQVDLQAKNVNESIKQIQIHQNFASLSQLQKCQDLSIWLQRQEQNRLESQVKQIIANQLKMCFQITSKLTLTQFQNLDKYLKKYKINLFLLKGCSRNDFELPRQLKKRFYLLFCQNKGKQEVFCLSKTEIFSLTKRNYLVFGSQMTINTSNFMFGQSEVSVKLNAVLKINRMNKRKALEGNIADNQWQIDYYYQFQYRSLRR